MFYDAEKFLLVQLLEENWQTIREEYLALSEECFDPWVQQSMHGKGWSVFGLIAGGMTLPTAKKCPRTTELLMQAGNVGLAGFSRMAPGTHILPHQGWAENEYRCHLGLVVPEGCRLKVLEETRHWEEGRCLVFDDTAMHEAWNDSDKTRGNLMVDFLKPGKKQFSIDNVPS
ncbi:MAG: aspartyl/asparaginyl beta-hydroxylase domain-containing protein, partial [Planctomycetota bacterium]